MLRSLHCAALARTRSASVASLSASVLRGNYRWAATSAPSSDGANKPTETAKEGGARLVIDPSRLPNSIPGVTAEELAARLQQQMERARAAETATMNQQLEAEVARMQLSLPPDAFEAYLVELSAKLDKAERERLRYAAMSPLEQQLYQQKLRRKERRDVWLKDAFLVFVFGSTIFFMFGLFMFFY